jgi:tRNA threonylcarbamoyladenosine biosynthesis protein TsaE
VIGLVGPLGAGKTVFVKGLAEGLGIAPASVSSPTFVIAQQYRVPPDSTPRPEWLHHVDLYRLESEDELEAMGFADLFDPACVLAVEWADRFPDVLGPERLEIELEGPGLQEDSSRSRRARVRAFGAVAETALQDWQARVPKRFRSDFEGDAGAAGTATNPNPNQRVTWGLVLALLLAGVARLGPGAPPSACDHPVSIEADELGTSGVACPEEGPIATPPHGVGGLLFGHPLDLSVVSSRQLETLPGIGPSRARAIVEARARAPFDRVADLERVHGIGPRTVERLSGWLTVSATQGAGFATPGMPTTGDRKRG